LDRSPLIRFRRRGIEVAELYFEDQPPEELPPVDLLRIVSVLEPSSDGPWRQHDTLVVDLTAGEDELLGQMSKGTRYEIRRAVDRDGLTAEAFDLPTAETLDEFAGYYDEFARGKGLGPVFRPRLEAMAASRMLVLSRVSREDGGTLAWHAYARSPGRALLLYSAALFRDHTSGADRSMAGRANRYLHWDDMLRFRDAGCGLYDLGGIDVAQRDPATTRIAAFKKGFGGRLAPTYKRATALSAKGRAVQSLLRLRGVEY
jgi:GNAT superfamily N-acetyltransferase